MKLLTYLLFPHKISIGMVGMGLISNIHWDAYQMLKDVEVKAFSDTNQRLLLQKSRQFAVLEVYPDYHYMLDDDQIDLIDVMTPHFSHKQIVCDALKAGKVVLCEKPLATRTKDVLEIIKVSLTTKKSVYLKQYLRFSRAYQKALKLLQEGSIGTPYFATCMFTGNSIAHYRDLHTWRADKVEAGGGVFVDVGVHMLDLLQTYFGLPQAIFAETRKVNTTLSNKGEDLTSVLIDFPKDMLVSLSCTHNDIGFRFRWEVRIYGKKGVISIIDEKGKLEKILRVFKENKITYEYHETEWWRLSNIRAIHDIITRIKSGYEPIVSLSEAKHAIKTIESAYLSAQIGKKVLI